MKFAPVGTVAHKPWNPPYRCTYTYAPPHAGELRIPTNTSYTYTHAPVNFATELFLFGKVPIYSNDLLGTFPKRCRFTQTIYSQTRVSFRRPWISERRSPPLDLREATRSEPHKTYGLRSVDECGAEPGQNVENLLAWRRGHHSAFRKSRPGRQ